MRQIILVDSCTYFIAWVKPMGELSSTSFTISTQSWLAESQFPSLNPQGCRVLRCSWPLTHSFSSWCTSTRLRWRGRARLCDARGNTRYPRRVTLLSSTTSYLRLASPGTPFSTLTFAPPSPRCVLALTSPSSIWAIGFLGQMDLISRVLTVAVSFVASIIYF